LERGGRHSPCACYFAVRLREPPSAICGFARTAMMSSYEIPAPRFVRLVFPGPVFVLCAQAGPRCPGDRDPPVRTVIPGDVSRRLRRAAAVLEDRGPHHAAA